MRIILTALACATLVAAPMRADPPVIESASASRQGDTWRFDVTVSHPDTGWEHYADGWEVLTPQGERLGFRELLHPHVEEQPFTRSLRGVAIPEAILSVHIRARCNVDGWAETMHELDLPRDAE